MLLAKTLRSSTLRLALLAIAIFGATVIGLFSYVYGSTASFVRSRADGAITAEQEGLLRTYQSAGRPRLIAAIEQRIAEQRLAGGQYLLADAAGARLAGNLAGWPPALAEASGWGTFSAPERAYPADKAPLVRAAVTTLSDGSRLLVGHAVDDLETFTRTIETALLLSLVLIFVLAAVASISVTRRTVGRIEAINATSRAIMQRGLGERIPLRGSRDEWDHLAANLNSMLDRIEGLMAQVKQVTDNVAHDLRTPLARMRGRLEKAYSAQGATEREHALIGDTLADLDGVLRMFSSLTRISQIEANERTDTARPVNLSEIAREVTELFDAAAEDKGGRLAVTGSDSVRVLGDRDLLFDALANLVDNAIKHGRSGGHVTVAVSRCTGGSEVCVADDGPGIPAEEREHVFKRFYRLERSRRTPGNGLGLSLVAAVARLHGAHVEMEDNAPGLRVRLRFPAAPAADAASTVM
ncbi:MAG: HAMP domain-containing protein [Bradyrhizobiaceae bacterium]|nr:HAMP domain-containing protein [Bradyrhizobiaceae bacterium]